MFPWRVLAVMAVMLAGSPGGYAQPAVVTFTEIFRIGDESADNPVFLDWVNTMAVDSEDQLYLTDGGFKGIRMFSKDGVLLREIGREGNGPGEFTGPPSAHIGPGDTLYVWDRQINRLSIFRPRDQSLVTSVTVRHSESRDFRPINILGITDQGLLMEFSGFNASDIEDAASQSHRAHFVYRNGATASFYMAQLPGIDFVPFRMGGVTGVRYLPYAAHPHFALSADGILYYGMGDAIDLTGIPLDGSESIHISLPHEQVPVTPAEREASAAGIRVDDLRKDVLANIPEYKPAFRELLLDGTGHLWIMLSRPEGAQTTEWLVLDNSGEVVARANPPKGTRLVSLYGSRAYGEGRDEDTGAPFAVAWEISF